MLRGFSCIFLSQLLQNYVKVVLLQLKQDLWLNNNFVTILSPFCVQRWFIMSCVCICYLSFFLGRFSYFLFSFNLNSFLLQTLSIIVRQNTFWIIGTSYTTYISAVSYFLCRVLRFIRLLNYFQSVFHCKWVFSLFFYILIFFILFGCNVGRCHCPHLILIVCVCECFCNSVGLYSMNSIFQ